MRTIKALQAITGTLSAPGKMEGCSTNINAKACKTGGFLRTIEGSTCAKCYACKGRYSFQNVQDAMDNRLNKRKENMSQWVYAMAELITKKSPVVFRWHDSGDIQNVAHLRQILAVVLLTPDTNHWLPTREYSMVDRLTDTEKAIAKTFVRLSAPMIGGKENNTGSTNPKLNRLMDKFNALAAEGFKTSTVGDDDTGFQCPAILNHTSCSEEDCRACYDDNEINVNYPQH